MANLSSLMWKTRIIFTKGCQLGYNSAAYHVIKWKSQNFRAYRWSPSTLYYCHRTLCSFDASDTTWNRNMTTNRKISTSSKRHLKLPQEQTFSSWDHDFWQLTMKQKRLSLERFAKQANINPGMVFRGVYLVLVKAGKDFIPPYESDEVSPFHVAFSSPDVVATTFSGLRQIKGVVIQDRFYTPEEWEEIIQSLLPQFSRSFSLYGLMNFLTLNSMNVKVDQSVNLDEHVTSPLLQSYLDYIFVEQNQEFFQRALLCYINLCQYLQRYDLIEKAYGRAKDIVKIFSPAMMSTCLTVLERSKYWKDLYHFNDVLKELIEKQHLGTDTKTAITALRNGDLETGFSLMNDVFNPKERRSSMPKVDGLIDVMVSEFRYDEDLTVWKRNRELVECFFLLLADKNIYPNSREVAQKVADWFTGIKNEKWEYAHVDATEIAYRRCPVTGVSLKQKQLTDEEYEYLSKFVLKEVLMMEQDAKMKYPAKVSFQNTDPREMKSFFSMMYENGPFDFVIDGMNLYYTLYRKKVKFAMEVTASWLRNVMRKREKNLGRKLNVLIVFKHHLSRSAGDLFEDFATVWYSMDDSEDDPYFLYAALLSGRNCKLLTQDQLKDLHHLFRKKFDYNTFHLIFKWQQIHQDLSVMAFTKKMVPQYFDVSIQRTPRTWHFPYYSDSPSPLPNKWLCLEREDMATEDTRERRTRTY